MLPVTQLMPVLLDACGSSHCDLRQCAVYGVGVGAALAPQVFKQHAPAALAAITAIVTAQVRLGVRALGVIIHRMRCCLSVGDWDSQ